MLKGSSYYKTCVHAACNKFTSRYIWNHAEFILSVMLATMLTIRSIWMNERRTWSWHEKCNSFSAYRFPAGLKVACVVEIKLFFMDWFYYDLIVLIK